MEGVGAEGAWKVTVKINVSWFQAFFKINTCNYPIPLYRCGKRTLERGKSCAQNHIDSMWQTQELNSGAFSFRGWALKHHSVGQRKEGTGRGGAQMGAHLQSVHSVKSSDCSTGWMGEWSEAVLCL